MSTHFDIRKIDEGLCEDPCFFPYLKGGKWHYRPNKGMKQLHERLYQPIREVASDNLIFAVNGSIGCSAYFHVWEHTAWGRHRHFCLLDLKNAYGQLMTENLAAVFCKIFPHSQPKSVEKVLNCYFVDPYYGILRGGSASPELFNMGMKPTDEKVLAICERHGLNGTRYFDDWCISSHDYISSSVRRSLRRAIEEDGFRLNHGKSRVLDLEKKPIKITGLMLDKDGRITIPSKFKQNLKGFLYCALNGDEGISRQRIEGRWGYFSYIHLRLGRNQPLTRDDREIVRMFKQYRRMIGKPLPKILLPPKRRYSGRTGQGIAITKD